MLKSLLLFGLAIAGFWGGHTLSDQHEVVFGVASGFVLTIALVLTSLAVALLPIKKDLQVALTPYRVSELPSVGTCSADSFFTVEFFTLYIAIGCISGQRLFYIALASMAVILGILRLSGAKADRQKAYVYWRFSPKRIRFENGEGWRGWINLKSFDEVQQFPDRIEFKRKLEPVISIPQAAFPSEEVKQQIFQWILDSRKPKAVTERVKA